MATSRPFLNSADSSFQAEPPFHTPAALVAHAPGKLYILGEYAVVEPGHRAIVTAVNRHVHVKLHPRAKAESYSSPGYIFSESHPQGHILEWRNLPYPSSLHRSSSGEIPSYAYRPQYGQEEKGYYSYICAALRLLEALRAEKTIPAAVYDLYISSDLDDPSTGRKFGLGSSAAVTVATVAALNSFYGLGLEAEGIYRLAMLATATLKPQTSGGDLAASAVGGWVLYASPDRHWLLEQLEKCHHGSQSLEVLLSTPWKDLLLRPLPPDSQAELAIGWTGSPADTGELVNTVKKNDALSADFLDASDNLVDSWCEGKREDSIPRARLLLSDLSRSRGSIIETETLTTLCTIAQEHGWQAKSSGAGGGDCGIALRIDNSVSLGDSISSLSSLWHSWEQSGIIPLSCGITHQGAHVDILNVHTHRETAPQDSRKDDFSYEQ